MMPTTAARRPPQIRAIGQWLSLPGLAYGLRQPSLVGTIVLDGLSRDGLARLAAALAAASGEPAPAAAASGVECVRLMARWICRLQVAARIPVAQEPWVDALDTRAGAVNCEVALPSFRPEAVAATLRWVLAATARLIQDPRAVPGPGEQAELDRALQPLRPGGINAFSVALAAHRLNLPFWTDSNGISTLGTGIHSRWMRTTDTDRTSAMGAQLAARKSRTAVALRTAGLPGAVNELVETEDQAVAAAARLGYPVVVKPDDLEQGKGVAAGLRDESEVREAFGHARTLSRRVLVERHAEGWTHRLTVSHGRVIKAVKRQPGGVRGDGVHTVRELVDLEAASPLGQSRLRIMGKAGVSLDAEATGLLAHHGLTADSVPDAGRFVRLRRRDNFNAGGTNVDLTLDSVHPDNLQLAVDAARQLRLDLAGIDLIIEDAAVSWLTCSALICEVNALPQLYATEDDPIYDRILRDVMGDGPCRIPARL